MIEQNCNYSRQRIKPYWLDANTGYMDLAANLQTCHNGNEWDVEQSRLFKKANTREDNSTGMLLDGMNTLPIW